MFRRHLDMRWVVISCAIIFLFSSCSLLHIGDIDIVDAKTVTAVDEKLMPVRIVDTFPKDTSKVVCWFQWKNAKVNIQIMAKWHYITDDIHILDYPFYIPKKAGTGSVALSAPEGKNLPAGEYRVQLVAGGYVFKTANFKIE